MSLPTEAELKARVYAIKKMTNAKVGHIYEEIAKQHGFRTYAAMRSAMLKAREQ